MPLIKLYFRPSRRNLDGLQHWRLVSLWSFHSFAGGSVGGHSGFAAALAVHIHQLVKVKARPLHHLHLPDVHVVEGVDSLASLLNITGNGVRDQLVDDVLQVGGGHLAADDVDHLLADVPHLPSLGVGSLLGGQLLLACESNAENPEGVAISGLDVAVGLDEGLPLLHHGPQLVSGQAHAVEVGEAVLALNLLAHKLELSEGPLGVVLILQISKRDLVDAALETIGGDPCTSGPVHQSLANLADFEEGGRLDVIPVLPGEGVDNLLLGSLLATNLQSLVFADSHTSLVEVNQAIK